MKNKTLAIIGCGAAAASFIRSFIQQCNEFNLKNINLLIFEPSPTLGVGVAYQEDLNNLLINRPAQTMSANLHQPDEFFRWLIETNKSFPNEDVIKEKKYIYPSRKTFGYYLTELTEKSISKANHYNIVVKIIKDSVIQLGKGSPVYIKTRNNSIYFAHYILLATGNNQPKDFYNLNYTPKYINSPFPLYKNLSSIGANETVGILGNSLTAIDVALSLHYLGHCSNVTMLSRSHVNPRVRNSTNIPYKLKFLTTSAIWQKKDNAHKVTLMDLLKLFRKELKQNNIHWKQFFVEDSINFTFDELIASELEAAKSDRQWQNILGATNEIIEEAWHALDHQSKEIFIKYFQRIWLNYRTPIPPINASLLSKITEQKKLFSGAGLEDLKYDWKVQKYIGIAKGNQFVFDWVINATGPARHVQPEDELMYNLIQSGIVRTHPFGGIDVDFNTSAIINDRNHININIRVLGHNTIGVYNYTSSLEMITKKAEKIACDFAYLIKKDILNGQDKVVNSTTFDSLSYLA